MATSSKVDYSPVALTLLCLTLRSIFTFSNILQFELGIGNMNSIINVEVEILSFVVRGMTKKQSLDIEIKSNPNAAQYKRSGIV